MLICVTAIAVALGLSMVIGSFVATLLFAIVYCVLPTPLVIFAIFARGDTQAFAIGALIPWWTLQTWMPGAFSFSSAIWLLAMCTACGARGRDNAAVDSIYRFVSRGCPFWPRTTAVLARTQSS